MTFDPQIAVKRALSMLGRKEPYVLGAGNYDVRTPDEPFTAITIKGREVRGCDCWGFAGAWCLGIPRHRPGYNVGSWATVSDDVNCDSAIEQAEHTQSRDRVFEAVELPSVGDLLVWPSVRCPGCGQCQGRVQPVRPKGHRLRIGHVGIIVAVPSEWDAFDPPYGLLDVAQCCARTPAIRRTNGAAWLGRAQYMDRVNVAWRTRILRAA